MTYKILLPIGGFVCRSTVRAWTPLEEADTVRLAERNSFMEQLNSNIGPACILDDFPANNLTPDFEFYADGYDEDGFEGTPDEIPEAPLPTPEASDVYVGVTIKLPRAGRDAIGRVKKRARDNDGNVVGRAHEKPILDTRQYIVEFEDGEEAELAANVIATSMYAQCDPDGHEYFMFDSLVDFRRSDDALRPEDQKVLKADGRSYMRRTTAGWELCVLWKDGSTTWENLSEMKESYPIECAKYAVSQILQDDPAF